MEKMILLRYPHTVSVVGQTHSCVSIAFVVQRIGRQKRCIQIFIKPLVQITVDFVGLHCDAACLHFADQLFSFPFWCYSQS